MKRTHKQWTALAGLAVAVAGGTNAHAQSADALLDKLVDKGIITPTEAKELREEADKDFSRAFQAKMGMPDWVTSLKINGDVRGRLENFHSDDDVFKDRTRFRYRVRLGFVATAFDNFEFGLRLSSSDPAAGGPQGGDPISGNTTFQDNATRKFIYLDLAYGKWTMANNSSLFSALTLGKMANPFVFPSDFVFDPDYDPEGLGEQLALHISDAHDLKLNLGAFALDEVGADSDDPFMTGAQIRFDSKWSPKVATSFGAAMFGIANDEALDASPAGVWTVPNQNGGNTRVADPAAGRIGRLAYNMNPIVGDGSITYNLEKFYGYNALFPITLFGEVMYNPAAPNDAGNKGWTAGISFGKAGKKGLWEIGYRYRYLGANAWWEEVTESDFGALYVTAPPSSGASSGYVAGTNVRGHIIAAAYSFADAFTLNVKYYLTELIRESPPGSDSEMGRLQVDANWKF